MTKRTKLLSLLGLAAAGLAVLWLLERRWNQRFLVVGTATAGITDREGRLRLGRRVTVQSLLDCTPQKAWQQVQTSGLLLHVSWPILEYKKADSSSLPAIWIPGETARVRLFGLGFIPLGEHAIHIVRIDPQNYRIQSQEGGLLTPVWDHDVSLQPFGENQTLYSDEIRIYAGPLTSLVACFARFYYRYRQSRWQRLARVL